MRLKTIEIENFKGIGARQSIELKPITLLFGPNSAGKSTILQALHYVREILERQNPDPDQTIAGGLIDLGGFKALVHNHELDRRIAVKLVLDLSDDQDSDRLPLNTGASLSDAAFEHLNVRYLVGENSNLKDYSIVQEVGVEVGVQWSERLHAPFVSDLAVEMDGANIAEIRSPAEEGRAILTQFNFAHPLLRKIVDLDDDDENESSTDDPFSSPLAGEVWELSRAMAKETVTIAASEFRVSVGTVFGALPDYLKPLSPDVRDPDISKFELEQSTPRAKALAAMLDELVLGPVRIVADYLSAMTYIGPLREIPTRNFRPQVSPDESRWANGRAAWDLLYNDQNGGLLEEVNSWLSSEQRLGTPYRVEKTAFREIAVPSRLDTLFSRGLTEDDIGDLQELYESLPQRVEIALRDFEKGILVAPSDVGVGISQMIPVIVGCLVDQAGLMAVEQPELHIHPAVQVGIGDLFIESVSSANAALDQKMLLVETHSEHIMLRLLRRIRETADEDLPPGAPSLTPDLLSVIFVEGSEEGVKFKSLRVDESGEFVDRWPRGFFDERAEELF